MTHRLLICAFALWPLSAIAQAHPYHVGSCVQGVNPNYATISAAVAAVPSGSIIDICPGTYPEQVNIQKPLTLRGIQSGNSGAVIVTVPKGGLQSNFSSLVPDGCGCRDGGAAQIAVLKVSGPVNLADIIVDGAGATFPSNGRLFIGIVFDSTPGTIDHVELRNQYIAADQSGSPTGYGIILADTYNKSPAVSILGSHLYRFSNTGIVSDANLLAADNSIDLRTISGVIGVFGIFQLGGSASIIDNIITGDGSGEISTNQFLGVIIEAPVAASNVESNTISNTNLAVYNGGTSGYPGPLVISHNRFLDNQTAVFISNSLGGSTIEDNSVTSFTLGSKTSIGISYNCGNSALNLDGNDFSGTTIALAGVPGGTSLGSHSMYHNVQQIEQPCQ